MEIENAVIKKADLVFDDIGGKNGQQFRLELQLRTEFTIVAVSFNPLRLPQLLNELEINKFSELEGQYIRIKGEGIGGEVIGIKPILTKNDKHWFKTENHIYFGSNFIGMWDKYIEELENDDS